MNFFYYNNELRKDQTFIQNILNRLTIDPDIDEYIGFMRWLSGQDVRSSQGICGSTTYGYGKLDSCGYWEYPLPYEFRKKFEDYWEQDREWVLS
jgi:hypothetical protein